MGFLKDKQQNAGYASPVADPMSWKPDDNIMAAIAGAVPGAGPADPMSWRPDAETMSAMSGPAEQPAEPQAPARRRISTLDIIGSILDAGAEFGDSNPGYREAKDRRHEMENSEQDRGWQNKFNQQKFDSGSMGLEKGRMDLANAKTDQQIAKFGQASRGLGAVFAKHGVAGVAKAFPLLAKQLGMTPEESAIFGESLAIDPQGTIQMIDAATTDPVKQGSPPKERIIAEMLRERDPSGALEKQYLDNLASGTSDYQTGMLGLGRDKLTSAERIAAIRSRGTIESARIRAEAAGKKGAAAPVDEASLNLALDVTGELRGIYETLRNSGAIVDTGQTATQNIAARTRASGFGQLIEGALGTEAQTARDKIAGIRPNLIRRIAEATGMTAAQMNSDKDMKLLLDQVTDPTMSYQANVSAIDRLEELVTSRAGARKPAAARAPARTGGTRPRVTVKPRSGGGAPKRMVYDPKTGEIR